MIANAWLLFVNRVASNCCWILKPVSTAMCELTTEYCTNSPSSSSFLLVFSFFFFFLVFFCVDQSVAIFKRTMHFHDIRKQARATVATNYWPQAYKYPREGNFHINLFSDLCPNRMRDRRKNACVLLPLGTATNVINAKNCFLLRLR